MKSKSQLELEIQGVMERTQMEVNKVQKKMDKILKDAHIEISAYEAEIELEHHPVRGSMGFCYFFWETRKRILKEKYGIAWKTPAEENPGIMYD